MYLHTFISVASLLTGTHSLPSITNRNEYSILKTCDHFYAAKGWLYGRCTLDNGVTWQYTGLDLNKCLTNDDGHLKGSPNGNFYSSCPGVLWVNYHNATATVDCSDDKGVLVSNEFYLPEIVRHQDGVFACYDISGCSGCN
ncbi:hypothetical protein F4778DRAFT_743380 [Xylariomycetidae sp. FL2044]|nr:hypothetical protein F4778DRAFT_743380 [Xylariomycetidae sp. FL2044]